MSEQTREELSGVPAFTPEQEQEIAQRCFAMVDYLSETASNIILNTIENIPCSGAKHFILKRPELLAVRAFEKAIRDLIHSGREPGQPTH